MNIFYKIDDFLRPSYQIVGAGIEWAIVLMIIFLIIYVTWRFFLAKIWYRTWLFQWIDYLRCRRKFLLWKREDKREWIQKFITLTRNQIQSRVENNRRPLLMEKYYERMFTQTEREYAEQPQNK